MGLQNRKKIVLLLWSLHIRQFQQFFPLFFGILLKNQTGPHFQFISLILGEYFAVRGINDGIFTTRGWFPELYYFSINVFESHVDRAVTDVVRTRTRKRQGQGKISTSIRQGQGQKKNNTKTRQGREKGDKDKYTTRTRTRTRRITINRSHQHQHTR